MKRHALSLALTACLTLPLLAQDPLFPAVKRLQKEFPQYTGCYKKIQPNASGRLHIYIVSFKCTNVANINPASINSVIAAFEREMPNATETIRYANKINGDTISYILNYGAKNATENGESVIMGNQMLGNKKNRAVALLQLGEQSLWTAVKNTVQLPDTADVGIDYAPLQTLIWTEHSTEKGAVCREAFYQCRNYHETADLRHFHHTNHAEYPTTGHIYTLPPRAGNELLYEKYRQTALDAFDKIGRHAATFYEDGYTFSLIDEDKKATVVCLQPDGSLSVLQLEEPNGFLFIPFAGKGRIRATYRNGQFGD